MEGKSSHPTTGLGPAHCRCSPVLAPLWRVREEKNFYDLPKIPFISHGMKAVSEASRGPGARGLHQWPNSENTLNGQENQALPGLLPLLILSV